MCPSLDSVSWQNSTSMVPLPVRLLIVFVVFVHPLVLVMPYRRKQGVAARDAEQKAKALEEAKAAEAAARAARVSYIKELCRIVFCLSSTVFFSPVVVSTAVFLHATCCFFYRCCCCCCCFRTRNCCLCVVWCAGPVVSYLPFHRPFPTRLGVFWSSDEIKPGAG